MLPIAILTLLLCPQDSDELGVTGQVGWQGNAPSGRLAPVWLDLRNGDRDRKLRVVFQWAEPGPPGTSRGDLEGAEGTPVIVDWSLPRKAHQRISAAIRTPNSRRKTLWAFVYENDKLVRSQACVGAPTEVRKYTIGLVGKARSNGLSPDEETAVIRMAPGDLPRDWTAYKSLDALIWMNADPNEVREAAQHRALRTWVLSGGTLAVTGGTRFRNTFLEDLLAFSEVDSRELTGLPILEGYHSPGPSGRMVLKEVDAASRFIRMRQGDIPIVIDRPRGAGRIVFTAFEPSRPPFDTWRGGRRMWRDLLGLGWSEMENGDSMSDALSAASTTYPDVKPPDLGWLFALLLLYGIVVGPLDYFVLRSVRRFHLTWFTFPAYVLGFTAVIFFLGGAFMDDPTRAREVVLLDYFVDDEAEHGTVLSSLLPNRDRRYHVTGPEGTDYVELLETTDVVRYQNALPNPGDASRVMPGPALAGLRLQRAESALTAAHWTRRRGSPVQLNLHSDGFKISNLTDHPLDDVMILTPDLVVRSLSLGPGESRSALRGNRYRLEELAKGLKIEDFYYEAVTGEQLTRKTRNAFMHLTFPGEEVHPRRGRRFGQDIRDWIRKGGRVVIASFVPEEGLNYTPPPGHISRDGLIRVFLGPEENP